MVQIDMIDLFFDRNCHIDKDDLDETFPLQYKSHDDCDEKRDSCNFDHPA